MDICIWIIDKIVKNDFLTVDIYSIKNQRSTYSFNRFLCIDISLNYL